MNREPILIMAELIINKMQLSKERVSVYNQNFKPPKDKNLFVVLRQDTSTIFSSSTELVTVGDNTPEWDLTRTYYKGTIVKYVVDGLFYQCLNNDVTSTPDTIADWATITDYELQSINALETYTINIASRNDDARKRKEEIIFSLLSNDAADAQELNHFKISSLPTSFLNISEVEGSTMLNRFAITINILAWYRLTNASPSYYDTFSNAINFSQ
tara:strand:- start:13871 stop:14512 length:642 start_codon:yes stop_codon:yes gene_type:complete